MSRQHHVGASSHVDSREMRDRGRNLKDRGMLEVDISTGNIVWINDFFAEKLGHDPHDLVGTNVFALVPTQFQTVIGDRISARRTRRTVVPYLCGDGRISWWYLVQTKISGLSEWTEAEHMQNTEAKGPVFLLMRILMDTGTDIGAVSFRLADLEALTRREVERLDQETSDLRDRSAVTEKEMAKMRDAIATMSETSGDIKESVDDIRKDFSNFRTETSKSMETQASEIVQLIGQNVFFREQNDRHEKAIKSAAAVAMKSMTAHATKESRGMARQVVAPVGIISFVFAAANMVVQNWAKIVAWF